ncbi:hydrogenase subunit MbhD domain-containing protein [Halochromatium glycolicum]|uniref:hydrogenase subunit MbhD domain-containing protein n=1 Tax=Halochromatium glycolicum TaxID=85075 RepID=UPI001F5B633E|nr:hydrogenase subunit MbhD domain-containing protein [Halochromatium glycolicum]
MAWLTGLPLAVDLVLGTTLLWLAWRALSSPDLFQAVALFIAFGVILGLVWARLDTIDIALAEIALGAGVTGALLLAALSQLQPAEVDARAAPSATGANEHQAGQPGQTAETADADEAQHKPAVFRALLAAVMGLLLLAALFGLGLVTWQLWEPSSGLTQQVNTHLPESGVEHPVTAVLLNFRGYDTLLEIAVLLLALIGVWSLATASNLGDTTPEPVLAALSRLLAPLMILVAAYLVWVGAHAPGGAFQAGSVLGAAGVLLRLSGWRLPAGAAGWPLRLVLALGVAVFAFIGIAVIGLGEPLLGYPTAWAKHAILVIELAATLSIGAILASLFIGGRP